MDSYGRTPDNLLIHPDNTNSNEELNVVNTKTEVGKNQCKPRERINYLAVKHIRNNITIR